MRGLRRLAGRLAVGVSPFPFCLFVLVNDEILQMLLEKRYFDPNYPDNYGLTPLLMATMRGEEG